MGCDYYVSIAEHINQETNEKDVVTVQEIRDKILGVLENQKQINANDIAGAVNGVKAVDIGPVCQAVKAAENAGKNKIM